MTAVTVLPDKAMIYATNARGLLIFREPDFTDVPPMGFASPTALSTMPPLLAERF